MRSRSPPLWILATGLSAFPAHPIWLAYRRVLRCRRGFRCASGSYGGVAHGQWRWNDARAFVSNSVRNWAGVGTIRRPWLLLTGDDPTIGRILPDATAHRWLITDDAVLLWNKTGPDSRPDDDWLRELYKLRRNRPIDAVILVLDGSTDLTPQRRSTNAHSVTLSRIANVLHWSAPVYILDVAKYGWPSTTAAPPCSVVEFAPDANERAIESSLLELRSRIGNMSVGQLIRSGKDRYSSQLSAGLDNPQRATRRDDRMLNRKGGG